MNFEFYVKSAFRNEILKKWLTYIILGNFYFQIAAISPADINYEETLSTLRYGEKNNLF